VFVVQSASSHAYARGGTQEAATRPMTKPGRVQHWFPGETSASTGCLSIGHAVHALGTEPRNEAHGMPRTPVGTATVPFASTGDRHFPAPRPGGRVGFLPIFRVPCFSLPSASPRDAMTAPLHGPFSWSTDDPLSGAFARACSSRKAAGVGEPRASHGHRCKRRTRCGLNGPRFVDTNRSPPRRSTANARLRREADRLYRCAPPPPPPRVVLTPPDPQARQRPRRSASSSGRRRRFSGPRNDGPMPARAACSRRDCTEADREVRSCP